jgi:hypothetical protein
MADRKADDCASLPAQQPAYPILDRKKGNPSAPSKPGHFTFDRSSPLVAKDTAGLVFTPYAVDFEERTIVEVGVPRDLPPAQRPFFYLDQFHDAIALRHVPVRQAAELAPAQGDGAGHIFIFGIGRAGSTLVSKLLGATGIASVSEPDILLDLGRGAAPEQLGVDMATWRRLYSYSLARIEAHFGRPDRLAIKFRAQSSNRFHTRALHRLYPRARFLFLFRDPMEWSASFVTKFGFEAETLKWLLAENLRSAAMLKEQGADLQIWRYEDIKAAPEAFLVKCSGHAALSLEGLAEVMNVDSQEGMFAPAQAKGRKARAEAEHMGFLDWWASDPVGDLLAALGLDLGQRR